MDLFDLEEGSLEKFSPLEDHRSAPRPCCLRRFYSVGPWATVKKCLVSPSNDMWVLIPLVLGMM